MEFNTLPGALRPYGIRSGQGPRHLIGGMVASLYATRAETDNQFTLAMLTGGRDAGLPMVKHAASHIGLFVLDGGLEVLTEAGIWTLHRGDYASIPAGTVYGYRMTRLRNVVMCFATGEAGNAFAAAPAYDGFVQPEQGAGTWRDAAITSRDTTVIGDHPAGLAALSLRSELPKWTEAYAIESGAGTHLLVSDQLFTFAGGNAQTNDTFLTLLTEGPAGDMIPPHMHRLHDEMFFCLDGQIDMKAGDEIISLFPGDFLFVPRLTPHAYQFKAPYTRILGWLMPGIFEPFFYTLGDPTDLTVYPQQPAPFRFDRVIAKLDQLDIVPLGKPAGH